MVVRTVKLSEFSKVFGEESKLRMEEQRKAVVQGIVDSLPEIIKGSPVDTGLYAQSWALLEEEEKIIFGNTAPHAPVIELGARPFRPPLPPLLAWAKRVLGDGSQPPDYSDRVWALAVYTQQKIEREGMRPRFVMQDAIPMILKNIAEALKRL